MVHLLLVLVPLGLAAGVSPVMLTEQTVLLAGPGGVRSGFAYAAGTATVLVGVVGVVLFAGYSVALPSAPRLDATLDLLIGGTLLALAAVVGFVRPQRHRERSHPHSPLTPPTAFAFGLFSMATNLTTLALVVPAAKEIAAAGLPVWDSLPAAVLLVALACLPAWAPVALDASAPTTAHRLLDRLQRAIQRHGRTLVAWLITAAGLFLVARGIVRLAVDMAGG